MATCLLLVCCSQSLGSARLSIVCVCVCESAASERPDSRSSGCQKLIDCDAVGQLARCQCALSAPRVGQLAGRESTLCRGAASSMGTETRPFIGRTIIAQLQQHFAAHLRLTMLPLSLIRVAHLPRWHANEGKNKLLIKKGSSRTNSSQSTSGFPSSTSASTRTNTSASWTRATK